MSKVRRAGRKVVPAPVTDSPARIQSRPYDSEWARLPGEETIPRYTGMGADGQPLSSIRNPTVAAAVAGFALFMLTFFGGGAITLVLSLLCIAGAVVLSILRARRRPGSGAARGLGPTSPR